MLQKFVNGVRIFAYRERQKSVLPALNNARARDQSSKSPDMQNQQKTRNRGGRIHLTFAVNGE